MRRWADSLDEVDVTIAERRPLDALQALRRVEKMLTRPPSPQSDPLHLNKIVQGGVPLPISSCISRRTSGLPLEMAPLLCIGMP